MTARPMTAEERLENLLNELGWAYIEVGTGASDMQTSDDVERLTKEITDMFAPLRGMREALSAFVAWADRNDWGTVPKPIEAALRAALSGIEPGDELARPSASAPALTLSKDTTK